MKFGKNYYSIEEIEIDLLDEVKLAKVDKQLLNIALKIKQRLSSNYLLSCFLVIGEIGNSKVVESGERNDLYLINENMEIGNVFITRSSDYSSNGDILYSFINPELNSDWINDKWDLFNMVGLTVGMEINKELVEKWIVETKEAEEENKKEQEQYDREREEEKQKREAEEKRWLEEGTYEDNNKKVEGNVVIDKNYSNGQVKYTFDKKVCEIFSDLRDIMSWGFYEKIMDKKINFSYEYMDRSFKLEWENNRPKVNGVSVPLGKLQSILRKIKKGDTKDRIKLMCKLSQQKIDFLELSKINVSLNDINLEFDINITMIDEDNFKVACLDREQVIEWVKLKEIFTSGLNVIKHLRGRDFLKLAVLLGVEKQEAFTIIRKEKMLKFLKDGSN